MSLLISIHDVSPALASGVNRLWALCVERGVTPALLVVPNWHGDWPLHLHPGFVEWVRERVQLGAEVVLHGERHDEVGSPRSARDRWRAWGRTDGEGEFLTLEETAARERIERGLRYLRDHGLAPSGFVPPAWLAREGAHRAAAAAGLGFTEDHRSVRLFPADRRLRSPVVRWSARTALRAWGSRAVARLRWIGQRRADLPRLALHPQDLGHPATARSLSRSLDRWLSLHPPIRYADLRGRSEPAPAARG